ncbi:DUF6538 domain-containing protein [uncultured Desulfuromonas sp.]|uniref:DUF6538 domain-containing protein n=1 Tax=uncultured Desulfuromonas sp. TaxID=181013 RepID=UPI002AAB38B0|nr:DUF6538 domain-containing protein [uncultured Desulfuromonas sp.]
MGATHLLRRGEVYYFRRTVPIDIRRYFFRSQIWKSTRCTQKCEAMALVRQWSAAFDRVALKIRSGVLSPEEIEQIVQNYVQTFLDNVEHHRDKGSSLVDVAYSKPQMAVPFDWNSDLAELKGAFPLSGGTTTVEQRERLILHYENKIRLFRQSLAAGDIPAPEGCQLGLDLQVLAIADKYGVEEKGFRILYRRVLKAMISAYGVEIERLRGNYDNGYDATGAEALSVRPMKVEPKPPVKPVGPKMSELIDRYFDALAGQRQRKKKTVAEYRGMLADLIEIVGDKRVEDLCRDDVHQYLTVQKRLPANRNKAKAYRGLSVSQIMGMSDVTPQSETTIKNAFRQVKAFCAWLADEGIVERNVTSGINFTVVKRRREDEERDAYSREDVENLVKGLKAERRMDHKRWGERDNTTFLGRPERFWVPLLSLFCGLRLEEACQLLVTDVYQDEGVWCVKCDWFDGNGAEVKSLKTPSSKRVLPIPNTLIELGFIDFWDQTKQEGQQRLFYRLTKGTADEKYQANIRDWYNGQKGKHEGFENRYIDDSPRKSFHSLRHTYGTAIGHMDITDRLHAELMGHAKATISGNRYMKPHPINMKLEILNQIDYGVDFKGELGHWNDWH